MANHKRAFLLIGFQNDYFAEDGILRAAVEESSRTNRVLENTVALLNELTESDDLESDSDSDSGYLPHERSHTVPTYANRMWEEIRENLDANELRPALSAVRMKGESTSTTPSSSSSAWPSTRTSSST